MTDEQKRDLTLVHDVLENAESLGLDASKNVNTEANNDDKLLFFISKTILGKEPNLKLGTHLNFEDKLFFNQIHPRSVDINVSDITAKHTTTLYLLITYKNDKKCFVYQKRGKALVYEPTSNKVTSAKIFFSTIDEKPSAVQELYRHLPYKVKSPSTILRFSFGRYISVILGIILVSLILMLFNLTQPIITQFLTSTAIPSTSKEVVAEMIWPAIIIASLTATFQLFQSLISLRLETEVDLSVQTAVWERTFKLPIKFILKYTPGDMNSRIQAITTLRQLLGNQALTTFISFIFSFVYFVMMYISEPSLTWVAISITAISIAIGSYTVYKQATLQWPLLQQQADLTSFTFESINGVAQIRSTETEPFILRNWYKEISEISELQRSYSYWSDITRTISSLIQPVGASALFAYVVYRLIYTVSSDIEVGVLLISFFPFYSAYSAFNQNMTGVFNTVSSIGGQAIVNWRRARPILFQDQENGYAPNTVVREINGEIEFRSVSFRYEEANTDLFSKVSCKVEAGSLTAITGESGCGKSTMLSLILSFYEPRTGSISIDGISISDYNIRELRKQIGVVMQLAPLPAGTIYKIICGGRKFTEDQVWAALETAAIAEQIRSMPLGLDTVLNESSQGISGGQRQRIAIARAIISNPKILLMDEATSALDNESQNQITENLSKLKMTRVIVAHRLSTIANADNVIYMGNGTILGQGKFNELVNKGLISKDSDA